MDNASGANPDPAAAMIERMQADLTGARKRRDAPAVTALRTAMAAISNAEAPPADQAAASTGDGLGEHARLALSDDDIERILRHEIADRHDTIAQIEPHGQTAAVDELRAEIAVLERYVG